MLIVGILIGLTLSFDKMSREPDSLMDKNIAEYQCTFDGGVKDIVNRRAVCND